MHACIPLGFRLLLLCSVWHTTTTSNSSGCCLGSFLVDIQSCHAPVLTSIDISAEATDALVVACMLLCAGDS